MSKHNAFVETIDQIVTDGVNKGILHLHNEDNKLTGNKLVLKGKEVVNFGSCSYLGLEFDPRMITASKQAIEDYGTQFSESRAYVSIKLYKELEELFCSLFEASCIVTPTTTLGHIAAIPVLVNDDDAIILDHQVHNSVQTAVNLVKPRGVHIELLRHNRMDLLEERVKVLRQKHKKIWYLADGIYSMYGDGSPVEEVYNLMDKYPELHYYVDDAHGMSCYGKHGRGYVLNQRPMHRKMILATSLAKAFATGGAVLVFPDKELARKVRTCGGPLITSGPMQPATLGAAIASAKIHLSDEIYEMQEDLQENIKYANLMLKKHHLPVISSLNSPVFFVGVSLPKMGYNMVKRMLNEGYYLNLGIFPAVPMKNTGIRFTITRLHTFSQIEQMIATMAQHFPLAMKEEGISLEQIYRAFKMQMPEEAMLQNELNAILDQGQLKTGHYKTIGDIDKTEWDMLLGERGTFDWEGLQFLEKSFSGNELEEDNWDFDYLIIRDLSEKPVLATFLTTALWKDDMLSPAEISLQVEERRKTEPYYLTSKVISIGSLLTEGEHLYLDRTSPLWKGAMQLLFQKIAELQEKYKANNIMLRDFSSNDSELDAFLVDNGYFRVAMPDNHVIENVDWMDKEGYQNKLSYNSKRHVKRYILKQEDKYETEIIKQGTEEDIKGWYELYLKVKNSSMELNTYTLPMKLFENIAANKNWEVISLKLKPEFDKRKQRKPIAVVFNYITKENYNPMMVGLDYSFQKEFMCYRQALYTSIIRAGQLKTKNINLGVTASLEKQRLGAKASPMFAYMQTKDNYNLEVLGSMSVSGVKIKTNETVVA